MRDEGAIAGQRRALKLSGEGSPERVAATTSTGWLVSAAAISSELQPARWARSACRNDRYGIPFVALFREQMVSWNDAEGRGPTASRTFAWSMWTQRTGKTHGLVARASRRNSLLLNRSREAPRVIVAPPAILPSVRGRIAEPGPPCSSVHDQSTVAGIVRSNPQAHSPHRRR